MQRGIKSTKEQELSPDSIAYLKSRGGGGECGVVQLVLH